MSRTFTLLLALVAIAALPVSSAAAAKAKRGPDRLGGKVERAWPAPGAKGKPKTPLTRWLARQVGPRTPIACGKRSKAAQKRCGRKGKASAAALPSAVASGLAQSKQERISTGVRINQGPLALIRSFDIPADDPSYDRLLNWSWTYDSAVAATAFTAVGNAPQAGRLLDQLAALQHEDGSIEFAFDVATSESSQQIRSGAIAFAAIAFGDYGDRFDDSRYVGNARRALDYLLSLRNDVGLVRGGPDVKWVSTQHNLLTYLALTVTANRLDKEDPDAANLYRAEAEALAKQIDGYLIVRDGGPAHFRQGLDDEVLPLDTQAIGVIYAAMRGDVDLAKQLYTFAQENFRIKGRSVKLSPKPATYNMTYEAKGPFSGYLPYIGKKAPNVLWAEGTAEMRFVSMALDGDVKWLDESMDDWWSITRKQGLPPLGADKTVTNSPYNEYHVWPTAAAGAWTVLGGASGDMGWAEPPQDVQQVLELLR